LDNPVWRPRLDKNNIKRSSEADGETECRKAEVLASISRNNKNSHGYSMELQPNEILYNES